MEQPAFPRRFTPKEEGLEASHNSLYPEVLPEKGYLFEALIKVYQRQGNHCWSKWKGTKLFH